MRSRENYTSLVTAGFGLTLAILLTFQVYILREPGRIKNDEQADKLFAEQAGEELFRLNCASCHGENGEGNIGPALNSKELLKSTMDETFFSLIRSGVPGTVMPAWGQSFGGPLTDEQVNQVVAFIRSWEDTAPEVQPVVKVPDPGRGALIFASTCFICHGENGQGTDRAPALNDQTRLNQFDDDWYRQTIAQGRPAKGMPTWGTVLSPKQIEDVVALLQAWRRGETVLPPISVNEHLNGALFALRRSDPLNAVFHLNAALKIAGEAEAGEIQSLIDLIQENKLSQAETLIVQIPGVEAPAGEQAPLEAGKQAFQANCASCHAEDGTGGVGPSLVENDFIQSQSEADLRSFILAGRAGTAMAGFQGRLADPVLDGILALLRSWQP